MFGGPADLVDNRYLITPDDLFRWAIRNVPDNADAVTIGGNDFRAAGIIGDLEAELGRPVLTANQVLLWALMSVAGAEPERVYGYGGVFKLRYGFAR